MVSLAPFWLAGAAIIALLSLAARANRRRGWRRERSGAELTTLWELMKQPEGDSTPVIPLAPRARPQPQASAPEAASLVALEAALRRTTPAPETAPQEPHPQTADERVATP